MSQDNNSNDTVITRFPPSPTGDLHVGSARTALFNYFFAKKHDGRMVLRYEDTDKARSEKQYEADIKNGISWLDIEYDGPYRQSERTEIYKRYLEQMIEDGHAYVSQEEGEGRDEVIRFKNPHKTVEFTDEIRGDITVDTTDLGDFVIAKSLTEPLYHLAVVVDDYEMGVTHVIRGDDHTSNTPRQILLQKAIGAPRPVYAHFPMINGPDGKKLSKRHGATSVSVYQEAGYLKEAMVNYLMLLGWHPKDDQEILSENELIEAFSIDGIQKSPAVFSEEKLRWVNRQYVLEMSDENFIDAVEDYIPEEIKALPEYSRERLERMVSILKERTEVFSDIEDMANEGDLEYFFEQPGYHTENLLWRDEDSEDNTKEYLEFIKHALDDIDADEFGHDQIKEAVWEYSGEKGRGNVLWPMRYALCGVDQSPDPFELAEALGKNTTLERLSTAIGKLSSE